MKFYAFMRRKKEHYGFKKIMRLMKLTLLLTVCAVLQLSAAGYGQQVSLSKKGATLESVFREIRKQTGYNFLYNTEMMQEARSVDIDVRRASVEEALRICFEGQPLTYTISKKTVVVKRKEAAAEIPAMILLSGIVTDEKGIPLARATIGVKGSEKTTLSDDNGAFLLRDVPENAVLLISYTGYVTREEEVKGRTDIRIQLKEEPKNMDAVVVVGYGTQSRSDVSSSIGSFKPNDQNTRPVLGPEEMLQGRVAGVMISGSSGTPGSANRVSIRGIGSLSASNEPLYVIDGIPVVRHNAALFNMGENMNPLAELNPNDIESIEVLKDAASAAIYGSRATNGVIIITTKSGKKGKGRLSLNTYAGIQELPYIHKLKMAPSDLYLEVLNESIDNYNQQYGYTPGNSRFVERWNHPYPGLPDTDWMGLVTRKAWTKNVNLSFSGSTAKGSYYLSGSYLDQEGNVLTNRLKKYTVKLNLNQELMPWLKVGANTNFSYTNNHRIPGANIGSTITGRSLYQRVFDRPYKPNGDYYVGGTPELMFHNPLQILNEQKAVLDNYRLLGNGFAEVRLADGLQFKTSVGTDIIYTYDYVYYNEKHPYGTGNGRLIDNRRLMTNLLIENTLNYNNKWRQLDYGLLLGQSYQRLNSSSSMVDGRGFPSPSFDVNSVAAEIADASTGLSENALVSYFSRANLSWDRKYLLTLSMRADGSSRFAPEHRFGYFPSVSAGWILSKENFWPIPSVDLKLRTSYGATGNQDGIGNYDYQALTGGGYNYNNQSGIAITNFGNRELTWETANQLDAGTDISFANGRYSLTADYFVKNTQNLLYDRPIHSTTGFTQITSNVGSMRNWGWEIGGKANLSFGNFKWTSDLNISFIKNKLTSLIGDDEILIGSNRVLKVVEEVGGIYVYKMLGIYQEDKDVPQAFYNQGVRAGDVIYEDINSDNKIDVFDRRIVGSSNPDFFGGWSNTLEYKNFDLSFFLTFQQGQEIYAPWRTSVERLGNGINAFLESVAKERWTGPGTSNTTPRAVYGQTWNTQNSTRWMEDGSFLRMRSLTAGYNFPQKLLSQVGLSRARIYFQGDNLFLLTRYSGLDPEVNGNLDPKFMGQDDLILPQPRTLLLGLNISL